MAESAFDLGPIHFAVRPLDLDAAAGLSPPFVALVPAFDLTRLPTTAAVVSELIKSGCADIILAGPRSSAFNEHVGALISQEGTGASSPYDEVSDACNAALLGALIHKHGVAFCGDEPDMLDTLRGIAEANGWSATDGVASRGAQKRTEKPKADARAGKARAKAKGTGKAAAKAKAPAKPKPKPKRKKARR